MGRCDARRLGGPVGQSRRRVFVARGSCARDFGPSVTLSFDVGELTADEVEKLVAIIQNPKQFKIPAWFLNRQKDYKTGKYSQAFANTLQQKLREDLERLKKIRAHRGLRHYWGIRVRGQHTKSTGRRGKTMAATKK